MCQNGARSRRDRRFAKEGKRKRGEEGGRGKEKGEKRNKKEKNSVFQFALSSHRCIPLMLVPSIRIDSILRYLPCHPMAIETPL
jgi:hypothetical protein